MCGWRGALGGWLPVMAKSKWEMLMLLSERGVSLDYTAIDAKKGLQTLKEVLDR